MERSANAVREAEFRNVLFSPGAQGVKRLLDAVCAAALAVFALPLGTAIALAIVLDSPGLVFLPIHALDGTPSVPSLEVRTMIAASDATFREYLERSPKSSREWQLTPRLRNDPRITLAGRLLRRTSFDELPLRTAHKVLLGQRA